LDDITLLTALALVALGLGAGAYGSLIGAGGGFIIVPLLILAFGVDHRLAVGSALVTVALSSLSGSISFLRLHYVDLRSAVLFSLSAIPGTIAGVIGLRYIPGHAFEITYGFLLLALCAYIIYTQRVDASSNSLPLQQPDTPIHDDFWHHTHTVATSDRGKFQYTYNEPAAVAFNSLLGFMSGFLGNGGGPFRTPALVYLFHFPVLIAIGTSLVSQVVATTIGSGVHIIEGNVDYPVALLTGIGVVIGAQAGVRIARVMQARWLLRFLALAIAAIGIQLLLSGFDVI
jgi:uncharacterized membrane protein YfcA